jgi:ATP phosphoribosyltransferase regulatory subunit
MTTVDRWLLPDGIEEVLPAQAQKIEKLRRQLLNLYGSWGYQLVIPPLMEFTESLLIGLDSDIDLLTFKVTDQLSGRTMGIRADITPQVARIDAHSMPTEGVARLCYAGSVLHTRQKSLLASRSPMQLGAELYGVTSIEADIEVISLMLETLSASGLEKITLDLGHVGIYRTLLADSGLSVEQEGLLFDALQRKSSVDLEQILADIDQQITGERLLALSHLHGDSSVLDKAAVMFSAGPEKALQAVRELQAVAEAVKLRVPGVELYFDLSELRGYHYHTGIVFAAYVPGYGHALANGGRYDHVGEVFGRARPATGFNTDLKALVALLNASADSIEQTAAISAPASGDEAMLTMVSALRSQGETVIARITEEVDKRCNRELVLSDGHWQIESL